MSAKEKNTTHVKPLAATLFKFINMRTVSEQKKKTCNP
jgi:hypothetical protein